MQDPNYNKSVPITKSNCDERASLISNVAYRVTLNLPRGTHYSGSALIEFELSQDAQKDDCPSLCLDFQGLLIDGYTINDFSVEANAGIYRDHLIKLPASHLIAGQRNQVQIYFFNAYRSDGVGLHTYVEKEDGEQYIKTRFEADYCRYIFPCFDQPDMKATWQLSV